MRAVTVFESKCPEIVIDMFAGKKTSSELVGMNFELELA